MHKLPYSQIHTLSRSEAHLHRRYLLQSQCDARYVTVLILMKYTNSTGMLSSKVFVYFIGPGRLVQEAP